MKLTNSPWFILATAETIARFGAAHLVRNLDGRHKIIGGTPSEHSAAREWCSLFAPEIVFTSAPQAASAAHSVVHETRPRREKFLRAVRRKIDHHGFHDYAKTGDQIRNRDNHHHGAVANSRRRFSFLFNNGLKPTGFAYERI